MLPRPSEALARHLSRPQPLSLFTYKLGSCCSRLNGIEDAEIIVSLWDLSGVSSLLKSGDEDPDSSVVPEKCCDFFPSGWNMLARYKCVKEDKRWGDWIVLESPPGEDPEVPMRAYLDSVSF